MKRALSWNEYWKASNEAMGKLAPPTVNEQAWLDACRQLTCAAHERRGFSVPMQEQHHILDGGRRIGHAASIPLCRGCHQPPGGGGPAVICRVLKCTEFDLLADTIVRVMKMVRDRGFRP